MCFAYVDTVETGGAQKLDERGRFMIFLRNLNILLRLEYQALMKTAMSQKCRSACITDSHINKQCI